MDTPEERVRLVLAESERLKQYLHSLPPEAWRKPSACDRWEVRDVVAHLVLGAEIYAESISRGLRGDTSVPAGGPPVGSFTAASFSDPMAQTTIARRESLGDQVLSTFNATNDQLNRLHAGLGSEDWEKPCYHGAAALVAPVRTFVDLRMFELALHGWDIRSSLEPEAHLSAESLPTLMGLIPPLIGWSFWSGARLPAPIRYRFHLTGPGASNSDIVVAGDTVRLELVGAGTANVSFHCDTEMFVLLMLGRLTLPNALAQSRLVAGGEAEWVATLAQWFRGV
jgi:uncharacterized protein (TIGR03083 family)